MKTYSFRKGEVSVPDGIVTNTKRHEDMELTVLLLNTKRNESSNTNDELKGQKNDDSQDK